MDDLPQLKAKLDRVQRHVERGVEHLARQRKLIVDRLAAGKDVTQLREFLDTLEETQRLHVQDRDRVRREMDQLFAVDRWTVSGAYAMRD